MRKVVCAAIRAADGSVLLGVRHYSEDMHKTISDLRLGEIFKHRNGNDQGFVDQFGVYMDRKEAYLCALIAGQIRTPELYSEDLY